LITLLVIPNKVDVDIQIGIGPVSIN
jgi:hypothetical protein